MSRIRALATLLAASGVVVALVTVGSAGVKFS